MYNFGFSINLNTLATFKIYRFLIVSFKMHFLENYYSYSSKNPRAYLLQNLEAQNSSAQATRKKEQ